MLPIMPLAIDADGFAVVQALLPGVSAVLGMVVTFDSTDVGEDRRSGGFLFLAPEASEGDDKKR